MKYKDILAIFLYFLDAVLAQVVEIFPGENNHFN